MVAVLGILDQIEGKLADWCTNTRVDRDLRGSNTIRRTSSVSLNAEASDDSSHGRKHSGKNLLGDTGKWGLTMKVVEVFLDGGVLLADALLSSGNGLSRGFGRLHEDLKLTRRIWLPPYRIALGKRILRGDGNGPKGGIFEDLDLACGWTLIAVNSLAIACLCDKRGYLPFSYLRLPAQPIHSLLDYASVISSAVSAINAHTRCAYLKLFLRQCNEEDCDRLKENVQYAIHEEFFSGMRYWFQMVANISKIADFNKLRQGMRVSAALCAIAQFYWEPSFNLNFDPPENRN